MVIFSDVNYGDVRFESLWDEGDRQNASDRPPDQSTQRGHLSHPDFRYHRRTKKTTTPSSVD
jgi:hypothetical protein